MIIILFLLGPVHSIEKTIFAGAEVVKGEVIVKCRYNLKEILISEKVKFDKLISLPLKGYYKIKLCPGVSIGETIQTLKKNPKIEHVEPNYILKISGIIPNDPWYGNQYYLNKIQMPPVWEILQDIETEEVIVAVPDTGVDFTHPDLVSNLLSGWDFVNNDPYPEDEHQHGTSLAGVICAGINNGIGIAGMWNRLKLLPVKVLDASGEGTAEVISRGIIYSATSSAKVINLSLGTAGATPGEIQLMTDAINYAIDTGSCIVVAASGNDGSDKLSFPANLPNVISVGSVDMNDKLSEFSNYGDGLDFVAPGEKIFSTSIDNSYFYFEGTSLSAPIVCALAAILLSINGQLSLAEVKENLVIGCDDLSPAGYDQFTGYGRINAYSSILYLLRGIDIKRDGKPFTVPNPFLVREGRSVSFIVPKSAGAVKEIRIYNFAGELIRKICGFEWNGRDEWGDLVSTGLYFFSVDSESGRLVGKFTVIK